MAGSRRSGADVATGTVWVCSNCGNERRRPVVPVGLLNDARRQLEAEYHLIPKNLEEGDPTPYAEEDQ